MGKIADAIKAKVSYEKESYRMSQDHVRQALGKGGKSKSK